MALNLEEQLRFYCAYHYDPINIAIHITCVPTILLTAFLLGTNTPDLIPLPQSFVIPNLPPNLGTVTCFVYATLYVLLEPVAGGLLAPILLTGTAFANHLTATYGSMANFWAAIVHVACWIAQFVGHGVYEDRSPALLDNLVQAFFLAPLFVWLELLFSIGYRPELKSRVDKLAQQDIAKYRQAKSNGKTNGQAPTRG